MKTGYFGDAGGPLWPAAGKEFSLDTRLEDSHRQAQQQAALNNARINAQPVQHLIADPRETQLIAMFRSIDDRAQKTMMAMMGVAFNMHKRVGK